MIALLGRKSSGIRTYSQFTFYKWLRTDQGGPYADLDAETGAKAVLDLLSRDKEALNGKFLNIHVPGWEETKGQHKYDGLEIEW